MAGKSKISIYGAIVANILIAISKFIAVFFTGSSAMLAEGIHSVIDTGNGLLLLFGIKRSNRVADKNHPFGYGKEIYFWSFVVSILIFSLGGGFAIYEGIHSLGDPEVIENPVWNYAVLGAALLFEGTSLIVATREFRKSNPSGGLVTNIIKSKDPANFAVIIEDSAAVTGLLIALLGIFLSQQLQSPYLDGVASLLIGVLLLCVAVFLARETKGLLLGESAKSDIINAISSVLDRNKNIKHYAYPKTMHFGPDKILSVIEIELVEGINLSDAETMVKNVRAEIKRNIKQDIQIFIQINRNVDKE
ncbi:cation diffusion facilitator family transporter [Pricia antarctica]|uniref:Cation diffusion facilitator family transporter n=1 Tax=Pricia antarctica TaxID=641691 RepID=A0A1G6YVM9_9FLAO|nr:cation diffusion facilitator family transporter [Pricia antarctica]SDD94400.1 cation diffusion facilitator family transporter [Pricia antarctica]